MTEPDVKDMTWRELNEHWDRLEAQKKESLCESGDLTFKDLNSGDWFQRAEKWQLKTIYVKSYMEIGGVNMAVATSLKHGHSELCGYQDFPVKLVEKPEVLK